MAMGCTLLSHHGRAVAEETNRYIQPGRVRDYNPEKHNEPPGQLMLKIP